MAPLQALLAVAFLTLTLAEQAPHPNQINANLHRKLNGVLKQRDFLKTRLVAEKKHDDEQAKELAKKDEIIASLKKSLGSSQQKVKSLESRVESLEMSRVEALDELKNLQEKQEKQQDEADEAPPSEEPVPAKLGANADNDDLEQLGASGASDDDDDAQDVDAAAVDPEAHWDEVVNGADPQDDDPLRPPASKGAVQASGAAATARGMQVVTDAAVHAINQHSQEQREFKRQMTQRMQAVTDQTRHALKQHSHQQAVHKATDVAADIIQQHMDAVTAQQPVQSNDEEKIDLPPNEDEDDDNDDMAYETLENMEPIKTIPQLPLRKTAPAGKRQYPVLKPGPYEVKLDHAEIPQNTAAAMEAKHGSPRAPASDEDDAPAKVVLKLRDPPADAKADDAETVGAGESSENFEGSSDAAEVEALEKDDEEEDIEERKLADKDDEEEPSDDEASEMQPAAQDVVPEEAPLPKANVKVEKVVKPMPKPAAMPAKPVSKPDARVAARAARAKVVESAKALRAAAKQAVSDASVAQWAQAQKAAKAKQETQEEQAAESVSHELRDVTNSEEALRDKIDTEASSSKPSNFEEEALTAETSEDKEAAEDERMLDKLASDDNANL
eukprot:gnl/MRDRNA2_/MRDRNA2_95471_c0_seq1.p1 gnl/MRDRNA2_/MRDRNA2_95471_c0~~gnl/MRDRNA2_/MRDRNA2_95471_c0_seq1.p1  ORF type:complete len:614 (-),score=246.99 gnl/MRDRNA2_/MRDRNA2_95471_c0_seq1:71-1912(-)